MIAWLFALCVYACMYVSLYVCLPLCFSPLGISAPLSVFAIFICLDVSQCLYHICMDPCMPCMSSNSVCLYVIYVWMFVGVYVCMYVCMYCCMHASVCMY